MVIIIAPIWQKGHGCIKRFTDLPKLTELVSGRTRKITTINWAIPVQQTLALALDTYDHNYSPQQLQGAIIHPISQMQRISEKVLSNLTKVTRPALWLACISVFSVKQCSLGEKAMLYTHPVPQHLAKAPGTQWALSKGWRRGGINPFWMRYV